MFAYALTIFTGAFLLFQVQPLVAKYILPWFGGGPGVWTTCMLFFQVLLLCGYAYAHFVTRWLKPRLLVAVHLLLLVGALLLLPITPSDAWKPLGVENPTWRILVLLTVSLGLPYFVLSATSPLLQEWFSRTHPGRSPYRLYALSNVGSLLALISYPFFFEAHFTRKEQANLWGWGLACFVVVCAVCAIKLWRLGNTPAVAPVDSSAKSNAPAQSSSLMDRLLWLLLPACASILLLATTNKMCQDVAVIPFLWVLPLALYLLSFIISFDSPRWYRRFPFVLALFVALGWIGWAIARGTDSSLYLLLGGYALALFIGCMVCHGELYRLRPGPAQLTSYYLTIATGGALGGVLVAVLAPLVFHAFHELPIGFLFCGFLSIVPWARALGEKRSLARTSKPSSNPPNSPTALDRRLPLLVTSLALIWLALGIVMWRQTHKFSFAIVERTRNFYGVLTILEEAKDNANFHHLALQHGNTLHGLQFVHPVGATWPTLYYGQESGVGRALLSLPHRGRRIGLVGLGIGTLATYGRTNDYFRFYEINPEVMRLASKYFTYASHSAAKADCVIGDARLSLEKEQPQNFDLLVLDAFSGDSIPAHLLTKEAFAVYSRHLGTNGIIAAHTSNNYIDLEPLLVNLGREMNYAVAVVESTPPAEQWWVRPTIWILLSRDPQNLAASRIREATRPPQPNCERVRVWTDDFTSLSQLLR